MKITIEKHELGIIYRINSQSPAISLVGITDSIPNALLEILKTLAKQPNVQSSGTRGQNA
jgi:hypothetical protein